jgi:hypothetical protein
MNLWSLNQIWKWIKDWKNYKRIVGSNWQRGQLAAESGPARYRWAGLEQPWTGPRAQPTLGGPKGGHNPTTSTPRALARARAWVRSERRARRTHMLQQQGGLRRWLRPVSEWRARGAGTLVRMLLSHAGGVRCSGSGGHTAAVGQTPMRHTSGELGA